MTFLFVRTLSINLVHRRFVQGTIHHSDVPDDVLKIAKTNLKVELPGLS